MKKLMALLLVLALCLCATPVLAADNVTVMLDGNVIDCRNANGVEVPPILIDGTTYLPVRAIANALTLDVQWDSATKSVFINGVSVLAKKTDVINIFINGGKFTAKDANGNVVNPILKDGTTYLPVRAIGEAFDKEVAWDGATKTVTLTTKVVEVPKAIEIDTNKIYSFVNAANGNALTATYNYTLIPEAPVKDAKQGFKFIPAIEGYYYIQSVMTGQNMDVSGVSTVAGGEIITWEATGAENQMFAVKSIDDKLMLLPFISGLPVEFAPSNTIQSTLDNEDIQKWTLVELDIEIKAPEVSTTGAYRTFSIDGKFLTDSNGLTLQGTNSTASQKWRLDEVSDGQYIIINAATEMTLDVSGQSLNAGDSIGTWYVNNDPNQKWTMEKGGDNMYYIKSVHSGLYLTISSNNTLIQTYKDSNLKQLWTMNYTD